MNDSTTFTATKVWIWLFLISIGLCVTPAEAKIRGLEVLNPKTYRAPNGRYSLTVDPSDRYGREDATYRCQQNGQDQWSATLPFTRLRSSIFSVK
ncbi:MAG: hypothetical protein JWM11_1955 [Planctomycetaceae bacterium]|nr:hypothetical protein [Planctomycetaceae bacterium]